jgi:hypothetical protein
MYQYSLVAGTFARAVRLKTGKTERTESNMGRPKNKPHNPEISPSRLVWANIRRIQYLQNISNETLAEVLECVPRTLSHWDKCPDKMDLKKIDLFCSATGADAADLFGG